MKPDELKAHIAQTYEVAPDFPWKTHSSYAVFRHPHNKKWFALLMDIPGVRVGLKTSALTWVLNVKVDPDDARILALSDYILPAYHMNKKNWVSLILEDPDAEKPAGLDAALIEELVAMSYALTQ